MFGQGSAQKPLLSRYDAIFLCLVFLVVIVSFTQLTTWPRIFYDEGITIEIAENFRNYGVLDISTAPGKFTDIPYVTGSNGFPVTLPLAYFFKIFGFGLYQARIYALLWLIIFLVTVYFFVKKLWSPIHALSAVMLISSFAPTYDVGRRVLGEVPGFVFLLLGILFLALNKNPAISGIFLGLATVSKPSVYLFIFPALIIAAIFTNQDLRKKLVSIFVGMAPSLILWIYFAFPEPFSLETWQRILLFYKNPAASSSLLDNFSRNISLFLTHTTLLYFLLISIFIFLTIKICNQSIKKGMVIAFLIPYGVLSILYFLKSPGWLKYLIPLQFLLIIIFPAYAQLLLEKLDKKRYFQPAIFALAVLQLIQLIFFSNITSATSEPEQIGEFIAGQTGMVAIINSPHVASLIPAERRFHYLTQNDLVIIGSNPLDLPYNKLPRFLIIPSGFEDTHPFSKEHEEKLKNYNLIKNGQWRIWEIK